MSARELSREYDAVLTFLIDFLYYSNYSGHFDTVKIVFVFKVTLKAAAAGVQWTVKPLESQELRVRDDTN